MSEDERHRFFNTTLELGLSPCPNDTFLFHAWLEGFIKSEITLKPTFADIETLNTFGLEKKFPLIKLSFPTFAKLQNDYTLLDCGCILGQDVGPKVIARTKFDLKEIKNLILALPGKETMAHLLSHLLLPKPKEKVFFPYNEMFSLLNEKKADAAVIIHESRFTFERFGFFEIADLGVLWRNTYRLPIPLAGIALRNDFLPYKDLITKSLRESLQFALNLPHISFPFVRDLSQEKDPDVIAAHIALYVNSETMELSSEGRKAIQVCLDL